MPFTTKPSAPQESRSISGTRRKVGTAIALAVVAALAPVSRVSPTLAAGSGAQMDLGQVLSPDSTLSTSGDFATDTFGDPWDFSNQEDIPAIPRVGTFTSDAVSIGGGVLTVATRNFDEIRFLMNWSQTAPALAWGRDGWRHPIDAGRYTQADFKIRSAASMDMLLRWWRADGQMGAIRFEVAAGQWQTMHFDLTDPKNYPFPGSDAVWGGPVVRFELFRGQTAGNPAVNVDVDYMRIRRADAPAAPTPALPLAQVVSPSERGGADYATVERGNPWDFHGMDDVGEINDVANLAINADGDLTGTTVGNDPFIGLPLGPTLNTDRYHHLTIDVCYTGGFSLDDIVGGGMVGRLIWIPHGSTNWVSSQDFIVFPGCETIGIDLATTPPGALNDESIATPTGWRGVRIDALRFDLNEDRGSRDFTLRNISLTDDVAFASSAPIVFRDGANLGNASADIYATTSPGSYNGVRIAHGIPVSGETTFNWNGTDDTGNALPNGTYWIYIVMRNGAGSGVGYSTGPVRIERPVPSAPSYFVPLAPTRLLDTRNGTGGNIFPLNTDTFTELPVTGVGGVPLAGVTAVVMNVTVTDTTSDGFITAWPSGEPRPLVSNLNFAPGQTVPNLVTVKVGANGRVNLYNSSGFSNLIADVAGYYTTIPPASGGRFTSLMPTRLLDTRDGTGTGGNVGALGQNQALDLTVTGVGGVPATGVNAVALNVTVDQPTGTGFLTVWPSGQARPTASTHNFVPSQTVANLVIAKVGANGRVSIFNSAGQTHVVADVIGYFSSAGGLFVPLAPQRLVDTRDTTGGVPGPLGTGEARTLAMATGSPVPATAKAVIVNVTSVDSTTPSFITVWPSGSSMPLASTLNPHPGAAVANQAYLRLGPNGRLDAFNADGASNIIVDVFGYVAG